MTKGQWMFNIPNTKEGRATIKLLRRTISPRFGIRVYRRPVVNFGRRGQRDKAPKSFVVYIYHRVILVHGSRVCTNCHGNHTHVEFDKKWRIAHTCSVCSLGMEHFTEEEPLSTKPIRWVTPPEQRGPME